MLDNMSIIVLTNIHKSFVHFFGIGSVSSYYLWLKLLLLDLKMRKKEKKDLRATPVVKSSREGFINVKLVRVLPLRTNLASFFNNKHFLKKIPIGSCTKSFKLFHFIRFLFIENFKFFSIRDAAYWTTAFWILSYEISF